MTYLTVCNEETMRDIHKMFEENQNKIPNEFDEVEAIFNARTPILKFVHVETGLKCDLSFGNKMALMNSKFIKKCSKLDVR